MQQKSLRSDWKEITVVFLTTLILVFDRYRNLIPDRLLNTIVLYFVLPLIVIAVIFRESPAQYGIRLGEWKIGLGITLVAILGISLVIPFVVQLKGFHEYYGSASKAVLPLIMRVGAEMFSWEFFFRGFLFFALYRIAGIHAIWLQAVPFTMAHFGKPEFETFTCIFGGSAFGFVAWRTKSFLYPFLIHTYLGALTIFLS